MLNKPRELTLKEKRQDPDVIRLEDLLGDWKWKKALEKIFKNPTPEQEKKLRALGWKRLEEICEMTYLTPKEFQDDIKRNKEEKLLRN